MVAAAAGTFLASCAFFVASSGRGEGLAGPGELLDRGKFSRALNDIHEGEQSARRGGFMHAASYFLKAKDLWKASGERGWQSAQGLADAAVDKWAPPPPLPPPPQQPSRTSRVPCPYPSLSPPSPFLYQSLESPPRVAKEKTRRHSPVIIVSTW